MSRVASDGLVCHRLLNGLMAVQQHEALHFDSGPSEGKVCSIADALPGRRAVSDVNDLW